MGGTHGRKKIGLPVWWDWFEWVRPLASALLLPPVPFLALGVAGAFAILRKRPWRKTAGLCFALAGLGLWVSSTHALGRWLEQRWVGPQQALNAQQVAKLKVADNPGTVILMLGGGRLPVQPETGFADLPQAAFGRVRYGAWLQKQTGLPLAFAGGSSSGELGLIGETEAQITAGVLQREYGLNLSFQEGQSRYTNESARIIMPMLAKAGVKHVLLVTHAFHMPRSMRNFEAEAAVHGIGITAAPMGFSLAHESLAASWLPSPTGFREVHQTWREAVGWALGR